MNPERSRRDVLGTGAAVAASTGLSGCLGQFDTTLVTKRTDGDYPRVEAGLSGQSGDLRARARPAGDGELAGVLAVDWDEEEILAPDPTGGPVTRRLVGTGPTGTAFPGSGSAVRVFAAGDAAVRLSVSRLNPLSDAVTNPSPAGVALGEVPALVGRALSATPGAVAAFPAGEDEVGTIDTATRRRLVTTAGLLSAPWWTEPRPETDLSVRPTRTVGRALVVSDANAVLVGARTTVLRGVVFAIGAQFGLPRGVVEPVADELAEQADEHLDFEYGTPVFGGSTGSTRVPVRVTGEFTIQGHTVRFDTPSVPLLVERESGRYRWTVDRDLDDWVAELARRVNV